MKINIMSLSIHKDDTLFYGLSLKSFLLSFIHLVKFTPKFVIAFAAIMSGILFLSTPPNRLLLVHRSISCPLHRTVVIAE